MLVTASAGSGKTFVMCERISEILKSKDKDFHADLDQMLILTFTNQAAAEMISRLEQKIMDMSLDFPEIISQLDYLRSGDISTFHAFCQKMLKKYFYEANIPAGFEIVEEEKREPMLLQAIKRAISKFQDKKASEYFELMSTLSASRSDKDIISQVRQLFEVVSNLNNKEEWLENTSQFLFTKQGYEICENYLNEKLCNEFVYLKNLLLDQINVLEGEYEKLKAHLLCFYNQAESINPNNSLYKNLELLEEKITASFRGKKDDLVEQCLLVRDKFKKAKSRVLEEYRLADKELSEISKQHISSLIEIYKLAEFEFNQIKNNKGVLDFGDLEQKFLLVLENDKICEQISSSYKFIFVDEFQDTNSVQEKILNKLSGSTLMAVGDVKQSIYGFRGSKPKIFVDMQSKFDNGVGGSTKRLNSNFRSNKDVLNFVNFVFSKIMNQKTCDIDYLNTSMFQPRSQFNRCEYPAVEVCLVEKPQANNTYVIDDIYDLAHDDFEETIDGVGAEARVVAQKILECKGRKIYDEKKKVFRDVDFKDITILVRARTGVDTLCSTLKACGIPVVSTTSARLNEFAEIKTIINVLRLLLNPKNDVVLTSMLSSYFVGLAFDELAQIRVNYPNEQCFYSCVDLYIQNKDDEIAKKLNLFKSFIENLNKKLVFENAVEVVNFLIYQTGFYEHILMSKSGRAKVQRLEYLYEIVRKNSDLTFSELIDYLDSDTTAPKAPSSASSEGDYVRVETIHASKGLEYRIVILFGLGSDLFAGAKRQKLTYLEDFGFALNMVDAQQDNSTTIQSLFIKKKSKQEEFAESLRLLYVAMTRAKNSLIITGITQLEKLDTIASSEDALSKRRYIDLICGCLTSKDLMKIKTGQPLVVKDDDVYFSFDVYSDVEQERDREESIPLLSKYSQQLTREIDRYINYNYSYNNSIKLSIKNSVSSLAFGDNEYVSLNNEPKRLEVVEHSSSEFSSSDIGTIYHKIFEKIDFDTTLSIEQLKTNIKKVLTDEERFVVDEEKVWKIIQLLKPKMCGKAFKEKEFISVFKHSDIVENGTDDNVLVQGKIDLLSIGQKVQIFDYKLTKIKNELLLINKYKKQLELYSRAVSSAIGRNVDEVYIVDINFAKLIKLPK